MPAGLSTSRSPDTSGVGVAIWWRCSLFDPSKQVLDARRPRDRLIGLERDLGRKAETKGAADARPQMRRNAVQALERLLPLRVSSHHTHEDLGVAEVARDLHARDGHEPRDTRILRL